MRFIHSISILPSVEDAKEAVLAGAWSSYVRQDAGKMLVVTNAAKPWSGVSMFVIEPSDYVVIPSKYPPIVGIIA